MTLIRKANGELREIKQALGDPDLALGAPDTEALLANAQNIAAKTFAALGRQCHSSTWTPDPHHTRMLKELVEVTLVIEQYRQKTAAQDSLAQLSEEELDEQLTALYVARAKAKER